MENITKMCSQGENCIHPNGPVLPRTKEYFYFNGNQASARCKACHKQYRREHHQNNKDHDNARSIEYARNNPERYKHYNEHYYARKLENGGDYTHKELDAKYKEQRGCCYWCGTFVGLVFDIDHVIPISKGGISDISNVVISCRNCNNSKYSNLVEDWSNKPD